ncbi:response regulator [uncultured Algimonas sp.]|uniref:response regulator n=1 Tax=uncultured Algimonas sp. TaxID=1547920 RepID=UPI00262D6904|nr:response regulator [uncultured Algimonas sp.]
MNCASPVFNVLLIDDDAHELEIVQRVLTVLTEAPFAVDHVVRVSEAVKLLNDHDYDLVLLDNRLSDRISAQFSAPFVTSAFSRATVAIISSDIDVPYLETPEQLGVDHIVDKKDMIVFLRDQVERNIRTVLHPVKTFTRRENSAAGQAG